MILVGNAKSIAQAYEAGRLIAGTEFQVYVHDDATLLNDSAASLIEGFLDSQPRGCLVGVLGSTSASCLPWWSEGRLVGRVRNGAAQSVTKPVEEVDRPVEVGLLDGVVLAQSDPWSWTPSYGWHTYDAVRSLEARSRGAPVWVHPSLECEHIATYKGKSYSLAHGIAIRRLAGRRGLRCAYVEH